MHVLIDKPPAPTEFRPTHTIDGVPVQRVRRPSRHHSGSTPAWIDELGNKVNQVCGRAPKSEGGKPIVYRALPLTAPEPEALPEPRAGEDFEFDANTARAILHAATWPFYGEAFGYAESMTGSSATVIGQKDDSVVVRVSVQKEGGSLFVNVLVPNAFIFEVAED
jgi:hypothetical protein